MGGPAGEPALTAMEKGDEAGMDEVEERAEGRWTLEAGRRQSQGW